MSTFKVPKLHGTRAAVYLAFIILLIFIGFVYFAVAVADSGTSANIAGITIFAVLGLFALALFYQLENTHEQKVFDTLRITLEKAFAKKTTSMDRYV